MASTPLDEFLAVGRAARLPCAPVDAGRRKPERAAHARAHLRKRWPRRGSPDPARRATRRPTRTARRSPASRRRSIAYRFSAPVTLAANTRSKRCQFCSQHRIVEQPGGVDDAGNRRHRSYGRPRVPIARSDRLPISARPIRTCTPALRVRQVFRRRASKALHVRRAAGVRAPRSTSHCAAASPSPPMPPAIRYVPSWRMAVCRRAAAGRFVPSAAPAP